MTHGHKSRWIRGASIIEILLVTTIIGVFTRVITLNLFRAQQRSSLAVSREKIISDIRLSQMRSMHGDTQTPGNYLDYSIKFEDHRYILFPGSVYDNQNPQNEVVDLDPIFTFSPIVFPNGIVTFARLSGDVRGFTVNQNSVTIENIQTGNTAVISLNARGVPTVQ